MELLVRVNNQTAGRDKIARTIQYASKLVWNELRDAQSNIYFAEKLQILETTCSNFRKILRFGRCTDSFYSALSSIHNPDIVLKLTLTLSKISNALFLFGDHVVWLSRSGFLKDVDANKWNLISNKYWLLNIMMNIIRDLYEIYNILCSEKILHNFKNEFLNKPFNLQIYLTFLQNALCSIKMRQDVLTDTIKNCCDIWIPLSGLQKVKVRPSTIGLLGTISSLAALYAMVKPVAKLVPS